MTTKGSYDEGLYKLQKWAGCPNCDHVDKKMLGIIGAEFCPKGLTDIGPCNLNCRAFQPEGVGAVLKKYFTGVAQAAAVLIVAMSMMTGCSCHNPVGPTEPTARPTAPAAGTATRVPTAAPTAATPSTPEPTATPTAIRTSTPTATATSIPTSKHLKYYLESGWHADVYLYLPGMSAPITVYPGNPQTYEQDVPVGLTIPAVSWNFYSPVSPFNYTTTIWVDGVVYSDVTRTF